LALVLSFARDGAFAFSRTLRLERWGIGSSLQEQKHLSRSLPPFDLVSLITTGDLCGLTVPGAIDIALSPKKDSTVRWTWIKSHLYA
jgi:hypothetical protein